ncbi:MAG: potassium transporter Kup [Hyphomonadaceae bacterium]|nr:potassium transporter Kup [Hyphomonadaceae bacterium]
MTSTSSEPPQPMAADASPSSPARTRGSGFWMLTLGSIGVVFGDIGTSPLYAMREALKHAQGISTEDAAMGVVSLVFWALMLIVTIKYLAVVMRADNKGEGGTLAMMALAQRGLGRRSTMIFILGALGAALFYGDGLITPAVTVLSAAEGIVDAPGVGEAFRPFVVPTAAVILIALFMVQSYGTARVGRFFGPITLVWFATLAGLGLLHIFDAPEILYGLSPHYGIALFLDNWLLGFAVLGSVFLVVTGAEALYADIGHFGKGPIRAGWLLVAFPCLMLNYLGQGALVLANPEAAANPFFRMIPQAIYWPVLLLTTAASIIASQAVITGAFSMTQQAVQLGLLPRLTIRRTSETIAGQIYIPSVNYMLMAGVLFLLAMFQTSSNLTWAYGIAITAEMVITVALLFIIARHHWKFSLVGAAALCAPFLLIDLVFFGANTLKFFDGGWFPIALAASIVLLMSIWVRGTHILTAKTRLESVPFKDFLASLNVRPPHRTSGTAIFLTADTELTPTSLLHNLKHNHVLHAKNVLLTVRTAQTPRVPEADRVKVEPINDDFKRMVVTYGFMEQPNLPAALAQVRREGLKFDIMSTSFFLSRRALVASPTSGLPRWQDNIFIWMSRNAGNPADFFRLPAGRVIEMGAQVLV